MRACHCGCGRSLEDRRANVRYVDRTHQQRAYRAKVRAEAEANGIPGSLSFRTIRTARTTSNRHVDGPRRSTGAQRARKRRSRTPDLRISYRKAVQAMAADLQRRGLDRTAAVLCAQMVLRDTLTERQRTAIERRETRT